MSGPEESDRQTSAPQDAAGVLANLPRTRPQRSSPRRAAARARKPPSENAGPKTAGPKGARRAKATRGAASARTAAAAPAPRQGFECEGERPSRTVHPPGGAELVASVGEIVGELTKAGLSASERLIRDALSRLPL
jgi:hypothetical protein